MSDPKMVNGAVWTKQLIRKLGYYRITKEMTFAEIAEKMGFTESAISSAYYRAVSKGYMPQLGLDKEIPDSHDLKRVSTMYGPKGEKRVQWVIQTPAQKSLENFIKHSIEILSSKLPDQPILPKTPVAQYDASKLAVYPVGDAHFGLLSWGEETGADYDLKIAQDLYKKVFSTLINNTPSCGTALLVNVGDWFHYENMKAVTERSGHHLDRDSRYDKMVRVGLSVMIMIIETLIKKHKHVHVINAKGNHDETMVAWLNLALKERYRGCKNVTIDTTPGSFNYFKFGQNLLGVTHGMSKHDRLAGVMATDQAKAWGETKYRTWLVGHIHHKTVHELAGVTIESFNTLTAKDAWTTTEGFRSKRNTSCIVLDKQHGEVMRLTMNV